DAKAGAEHRESGADARSEVAKRELVHVRVSTSKDAPGPGGGERHVVAGCGPEAARSPARVFAERRNQCACCVIPMNSADSMVNTYACTSATNSSSMKMPSANATDTGATYTERNSVSAMRKKMTMCPATMLAKRRTVRANGLVNSPRISTGSMIGYSHTGTPLGTMCAQ